MHPLRCVGIYFIKSKSICADPQDCSPRNLTLCGRRRATGKGIGCVFIERKDKSFVSNCRDFRREMFLFFDLANEKTKTRGLFFDLPLVSLIALLLSVSFSPSFAHSSPALSWCALVHDALARGDAHPRLAHSASFHFFAFTPHLQSVELLNVRGEGFCIFSIFT